MSTVCIRNRVDRHKVHGLPESSGRSPIYTRNASLATVQKIGRYRFRQSCWINCYRDVDFAGSNLQCTLANHPMTPGQIAYTKPQTVNTNCLWDTQFPKAERGRRNYSARNRLLKGATSIVSCVVIVND
jgi:hypothetical protein